MKRPNPEPTRLSEFPDKSPADPRQYKYLRLANGLTALLVHDPDAKAKKSAVALSVGAGSLDEPRDLPGCAHFLEHMLFMGSEKFPDENMLDAYLSDFGGSVNAMTEAEYTMYFFEAMDMTVSQLQHALEIFCGFFVSPLMREDCVKREVEAVESEYRQALLSDTTRREQLLLCELVPDEAADHPYKMFTYGNKLSLMQQPQQKGLDPIEIMRTFFHQHYSAEKMKLVVVSPVPMEQLVNMASEVFEKIPKRLRGSPGERDRIDYKQGPKFVQMVPVKRGHRLYLDWIIPPIKHVYRLKPEAFISHLVGHEAEGSLAENLRNKGWASEVRAGVSETGLASSSSLCVYSVEVHMTSEGLKHWPEIAGEIRAYLAFLSSLKELPKWVYAEMAAIAEMEWNFQEKREASDLAEDLACIMQDCEGVAEADILKRDQIFAGFVEAEVRNILTHISGQTDNMFVFLSSDTFKRHVDEDALSALSSSDSALTGSDDEDDDEDDESDVSSDEDEGSASGESEFTQTETVPLEEADIPFFPKAEEMKKEPWFHTKFWMQPYPGALPMGDSTVYHLPEQNKFIPDAFQVMAQQAAGADLIPPFQETFVYVLNQLRSNPSPRVDIRLALTPPDYEAAGVKLESLMLGRLMFGLVMESLHNEVYHAMLASINVKVCVEDHGAVLKLSGFSSSVWKFVDLLFGRLEHLATVASLDKIFTLVQEQLARELVNTEIRCMAAATALRRNYLAENVFPRADVKAAFVKHATLEDVLQYHRQFTESRKLVAMVTGNFEAKDFKLPLPFLKHEGLELYVYRPIGRRIEQPVLLVEDHTNPHEHNCVLSLYVQVAKENADAMTELLYELIREPLFNELRTKLTLGYDVGCATREGAGFSGFEFWVQSAAFSPSTILGHLTDFLRNFAETLAAMEEEKFMTYVSSLAADLMEKPHTVTGEAALHWKNLMNDKPFFSEHLSATFLLAQTSKTVFLEWYHSQVVNSPRKVVVAVMGPGCSWKRETEEPLLKAML